MRDVILVVEDDKPLQTFLTDLLTESGYKVITADNGVDSFDMVKKHNPDIILLDLELPVLSGESVCLKLRKEYPEKRIIILTAKNSTENIVRGLGLGADDYITKPFQAEELLARIEARVRRMHGTNNNVQELADLYLNRETHEVKRNGIAIDLTPQEFRILCYLMDNINKVVTRDMILNYIWNCNDEVETRVVDVYIGYLRKKIDNNYDNKLIHSIRGFGYIMKHES